MWRTASVAALIAVLASALPVTGQRVRPERPRRTEPGAEAPTRQRGTPGRYERLAGEAADEVRAILQSYLQTARADDTTRGSSRYVRVDRGTAIEVTRGGRTYKCETTSPLLARKTDDQPLRLMVARLKTTNTWKLSDGTEIPEGSQLQVSSYSCSLTLPVDDATAPQADPTTGRPIRVTAREFWQVVETADLGDDAAVARLAEAARTSRLPEERQTLLAAAYALRLDEAMGNRTPLLRGVTAMAKVEKWCEQYGLADEAALCRTLANRLKFDSELALAGSDPTALANLSLWCRQAGLEAEALEAEAAALKTNPDDPAIRRLLGYRRDSATRTWIKDEGWPFPVPVPPGFKVAEFRRHEGLEIWVLTGPTFGKVTETVLVVRRPAAAEASEIPDILKAAVLAAERAAGIPFGQGTIEGDPMTGFQPGRAGMVCLLGTDPTRPGGPPGVGIRRKDQHQSSDNVRVSAMASLAVKGGPHRIVVAGASTHDRYETRVYGTVGDLCAGLKGK